MGYRRKRAVTRDGGGKADLPTIKPSVQNFIDRVDGYYKSVKGKQPDAFLIWPPETSCAEMCEILQDVLLPDDYYIVGPVNGAQGRTIMLEEILFKYYPPYKKYIKAKRKMIKGNRYES